MFYFVNLFILLMYSWVFKIFKIKHRMYFIITAIHIGGIIAFRSCYTGTDTYQYYNAYKMLISYDGNISELTKMYAKFPGWAVFFKAVSSVCGRNPNIYMFVTGYFIVIVIWIAIELLEVDLKQAIVLYYLIFALQAMNIARQNMALCLLFLSAALFIKGKKIFSIFFLAFAVSIHTSAIIGVPVLLVLSMNWTRRRVYYAIGVSVIALLSVNILFNIFTNSFAGYSSYLLGVYKATGRNVVMQIIYALTFLYAMWIPKRYDLPAEKEQLLLKGSVLLWGELLLGVFFSTEILIARENLYLQIFIIILVPVVTSYFNKYRIFYKFIVYGMVLFYFSYRIMSNYGSIIPYQTYLFER